MAFLEEVEDFDSRLKLITEIGRLNTQNNQIDKMSFEDIQQDCNDYTVEVSAVFC